MHTSRTLVSWTVLLLAAAVAWGQSPGQIDGIVQRANGSGVGGVTVVVSELGAVEITDNNGRFRFAVPSGEYTLSFSLGENTTTQKVEVAAGSETTVSQEVDWAVNFADTITVVSASRRRERLVEAPAAVTVIAEQQIQREASHGQLPKLLEHTAGAEATQSGVYDFNFNARGFNSSLNRRILVLIDGRDPSAPFLGSQEWSALSFALDELASVELVRGPGSALYGADAFNGVINMVTKSPKDSAGGQVKLTFGDLDTRRLDARLGGELGAGWYGRLSGGFLSGEDFSRSRNLPPSQLEYAGLNPEPIGLVQEDNDISYGSLRLDKYFGNNVLTLDVGSAKSEGPVTVTGIGRVQVLSSERPYVRLNFNTKHWNFLAYHNDRVADDQRSLSSGAPLFLDTAKDLFELQGNASFAGGRGQLIGGANYGEEDIDSASPQGVQSLMFQPIDADFTGVFGQLEYDFSDKVKGVVAGRFDDSSLHESVFSPRAALVIALRPTHTLRLNYGEAFQTPNYSEFYLRVPVAPPILALGGIEQGFCAPFGVNCGFGNVPVLALGNPELEVEEVTSFEIGYSGILNQKTFLTVDYYNNQLKSFITDLITPLQPGLGYINPLFGPYQAPAGLPAPVAAQLLATLQGALGPTFALLSNSPVDGSALVAARSYTNFGEVDTQGIEIGLNTYLTDKWVLDANYSWFDFDVGQQLTVDPLLPNAPENKFGIGISYVGDKFNAALKYRHSAAFDWAAGVFAGRVESYDVADLAAGYRFNERFEVGLNVSNLFDEVHYQIFGGDLLERRALAHVALSF